MNIIGIVLSKVNTVLISKTVNNMSPPNLAFCKGISFFVRVKGNVSRLGTANASKIIDNLIEYLQHQLNSKKMSTHRFLFNLKLF